MNQNENMGAEITLTDENESSTAMYDLSPEDFAALTATATEVKLESGKTFEADTCVCCLERAEHWFKLIVLQSADYSFSADVRVVARLYDAEGNLLASDNEDGENNSFLINYTMHSGQVYYLRIMPDRNFFMRFNTIMTGTFTPIESISISTESMSLMPNETAVLSATILPENATNKVLVWESSDDNIAEVDDFSGMVTAVSPGTATISARTLDGSSKTIVCTVTVINLKEDVEYHLLCNGDSAKALRVGRKNVLSINESLYVRGERRSYWNRQKWTLKVVENKKKLYTQLNQSCYLCNNIQNGINEVYVSNSASDANSHLTIISCGNEGLFEIKLTNSDLYLTLVECERHGSLAYWGEWKAYDTVNHHLQLWKFVEQPAYHHYGVDTNQQMSDATIRAVKLGDKEFVMRYYGMLDRIGDITIRTKKDGQSIVGETIENLRTKKIRLNDADYDYLQGADELLASNETIIYASKTVIPEELKYIRDHSLKLVVVYQNNAKAIEDFTIDHAKLDVFCALVDAKRLGQPYGTTIYFAVDFDPDFSDDEKNQKEIIRQYFSTIKEKIKGRYKIGVYGVGKVCDLIKPTFQGLSWLSNANGCTDSSIEGSEDYISYDEQEEYDIKQSEEVHYNGIKFDSDTAIVDDYGQW